MVVGGTHLNRSPPIVPEGNRQRRGAAAVASGGGEDGGAGQVQAAEDVEEPGVQAGAGLGLHHLERALVGEGAAVGVQAA